MKQHIGPVILERAVRAQTAEWIQDRLTEPDSKGFVKVRHLHEHAERLLDDRLDQLNDELTIRRSEELRGKVVAKIRAIGFRQRVQRILLTDPILPVAVTLVNSQCIDDIEHWGDTDAAYGLRKSWMPTVRDPGFALVHNSAAGIRAAENQAASVAGSISTAFKRIVAWVSRDLYADEARNAAAMVCAAAQVMNEVYSTDEGFVEARDSMVSEYRLQMVGQ